jgi:hypothetical protein
MVVAEQALGVRSIFYEPLEIFLTTLYRELVARRQGRLLKYPRTLIDSRTSICLQGG